MAKKIIDISHHQGTIDFAKLKDEVALVIIRVQYGSTTIDRKYKEYVEGCKKYNIPFGHYAYARFVSVNDAKVEAKDFLERADKDAKFLVVDVEEQTTKTKDEIVPATQTFIDYLKANTDKKVGLYTGHHFYKPYSMSKVKADFLWIPRYSNTNKLVKPDYACDLWQYTESGKVSGISGNVDINVLNSDKSLEWFIGAEKKVETVVNPVKTAVKEVATKISTYSVVKNVNAYANAADAKAKKNKKGTVAKGIYYVFNKADGMINVTNKKGVPGSWINPAENKKSVIKSAVVKYHTVKKNETITSIAKKEKTTVTAIKKLNPSIKDIDLIFPNQKVRVK